MERQVSGGAAAVGGGGRRRLGCAAFAALWVCVCLTSVTAALLAVQGDIVLERGELRSARLWLLQEEASRGLGFSSARFVSGSEAEERACVETRVRFLLWQSTEKAQNTRYCECYEYVGGGWELTGACPE